MRIYFCSSIFLIAKQKVMYYPVFNYHALISNEIVVNIVNDFVNFSSLNKDQRVALYQSIQDECETLRDNNTDLNTRMEKAKTLVEEFKAQEDSITNSLVDNSRKLCNNILVNEYFQICKSIYQVFVKVNKQSFVKANEQTEPLKNILDKVKQDFKNKPLESRFNVLQAIEIEPAILKYFSSKTSLFLFFRNDGCLSTSRKNKFKGIVC